MTSVPPVVPLPVDEREFGTFVGPHIVVLRAMARREVGDLLADDLVQETLLRAWHRRETYDVHRGSARAWLVGVLLDRARRFRTRRRDRPHQNVDDVEATGPDASLRLDVERAVQKLPPRQRQAVVLYYLADLSVTRWLACSRCPKAR